MNRLKRIYERTALLLLALFMATGILHALHIDTGRTEPTLTQTNRTSSTPAIQTATVLPTPPEAEEPTPTMPTEAPSEKPAITEDKPILYDVPMSDELQIFLYQACTDSGVPFEISLALIEAESSYRPDVISKTNDYGLMQINICNHDRLKNEIGVEDFLNPESNITAGIYLLAELFEKYEDTHKALMAYNMGENGARKQWDLGILTHTRLDRQAKHTENRKRGVC